MKYPIDGIELDIQLTKDHQLIVFHDDLLEKSTNCEGCVGTHPANFINNCRYHSSFRIGSSGENIISLRAAFSLLQSLSQKPIVVLDTKLYCMDQENIKEDIEYFTSILIKTITTCYYEENVFIESMNPYFLQKMKEKSSKLKLFKYAGTFESGIQSAVEQKLAGITIRYNLISPEQVKTAHKKGIYIAVWGVHTLQDMKKALQLSPDFIQSDQPKRHWQYINRMKDVKK